MKAVLELQPSRSREPIRFCSLITVLEVTVVKV